MFDVDTTGNVLRSDVDGEYCHDSRREKSGKPVEDRAFAFGGQVLKNVFDVDPAGDELRPFLHHGSQKPLAALVDELDFVQVDDAGSLFISAMILFPTWSSAPEPREQ
jgi:hypothetical protein